MARRVAVAWVLALALAASASAQTGSSGTSTGQSSTTTQPQSSSTDTAQETRPATTTFFGDTGLWFVPTAEVLGHGKWSGSVYRRGTNWVQGYTNVADFAGTFAVGIKNRAEIFGSFLVDTRIDRDVRPVFVADPTLRRLHRSLSPRQPVLDRRQRRRLLSRRESQFLVRGRSEDPAAIAVARHGQAADRRQGRSATAPAKPTSRSMLIVSKEAAKVVEVSALRRLRIPRPARAISTPRAARSGGAPASGSPRATGCGSLAN